MLLTPIGPGAHLDQPAALAYLRMIRGGMPSGGITSAYRSLVLQERVFTTNYQPTYTEYAPGKVDRRYWPGHGWYYRKPGRPATAVPGTSVHTLGRALDLGLAQRAWVRDNGEKFGWIWPAWARKSATFEPWHFEYEAARDTEPKPAIPTPEEDEMTPEQEAKLDKIINALYLTSSGKVANSVTTFGDLGGVLSRLEQSRDAQARIERVVSGLSASAPSSATKFTGTFTATSN